MAKGHLALNDKLWESILSLIAGINTVSSSQQAQSIIALIVIRWVEQGSNFDASKVDFFRKHFVHPLLCLSTPSFCFSFPKTKCAYCQLGCSGRKLLFNEIFLRLVHPSLWAKYDVIVVLHYYTCFDVLCSCGLLSPIY